MFAQTDTIRHTLGKLRSRYTMSPSVRGRQAEQWGLPRDTGFFYMMKNAVECALRDNEKNFPPDMGADLDMTNPPRCTYNIRVILGEWHPSITIPWFINQMDLQKLSCKDERSMYGDAVYCHDLLEPVVVR